MQAEAVTVSKLLTEAARDAQSPGRLDAELVLAHALGRPRSWLYAHAGDLLGASQVLAFRQLWARRCAGEPYAYLVGEREFHGRRFVVGPGVLVPRPDSECLLQAALQRWPADGDGVCIDAGSGSGILAICFALERPQARVLAIERSPTALRMAVANARSLGAELAFLRGDWLSAMQPASAAMVLSNPPYLAEDDPHLVDLRHEPREALVSGIDGLDAIRALAGQAGRVLQSGGWLLCEHGASQGAAVRSIFAAHGYAQIETLRDLEARERVTGGLRS